MEDHEKALENHPDLVEQIRRAQEDRSRAVVSKARRPRQD